MYKLYAIDTYKGKRQEFIDKTGYKEYTLEKLIKELEIDKGYHMRIHDDKNYIFFGDCDGFSGTFYEFAELLIRFMAIHYHITIGLSDISYTQNDSKEGSFHYSITKIYGSAKQLKNIHTMFARYSNKLLKKDDKRKSVVDLSVYTNHWFRYPNQSKEKDHNAKHSIQDGKLIDFVVEYIPKGSICIDDKVYISDSNNNKSVICLDSDEAAFPKKNVSTQKENKKMVNLFKKSTNCEIIKTKEVIIDTSDCASDCTSDDINNNIDNMEKSNCYLLHKRDIIMQMLNELEMYDTNREEWCIVGMALRNESNDGEEYFDLWHKWSKQSKTKYKGFNDCREAWDSFKHLESGRRYTLNSLMEELKKRNISGYNNLKPIMTGLCELDRNKTMYFPKSNCAIEKIDTAEDKFCFVFSDIYCPSIDGIHSDTDQDSHRNYILSQTGRSFHLCYAQIQSVGAKCFQKMEYRYRQK